MKKAILFAAVALLSFASCKKCETCTTTVTTDAPGTTNDQTAVSTAEVCGSDEIKAAEGTVTSTATQGGVTVTVTSRTNCQ
jgi:uncharacterized lipoprotein YajG